MNTLCDDCNLTTSNFVNTSIKYSETNQNAYFSADIIYSNSAGTVTANTLIHRFQFWLHSENMPAITVASQRYPLNKNCLSFFNSVTSEACMSVLNSPGTKSSTIAGVLMAGICIGIIATVVMAIVGKK